MPTYDYECLACGHEFETFQSIKADALVDCPACAKPKLRRKIGLGAGIIFKGSGFYETDYKRAAAPASAESKPADKAESKPSKMEAKPSSTAAAAS